jgi:hypothetical protein
MSDTTMNVNNFVQVYWHCDKCNEDHLGNCPKVKTTITMTDKLDKLIPCISCGVNADPEDGFGTCTCGAEKKRQAIQAYVERECNRARIDELQHSLEHIPMRIGELVDYKSERIKELQSNTDGDKK